MKIHSLRVKTSESSIRRVGDRNMAIFRVRIEREERFGTAFLRDREFPSRLATNRILMVLLFSDTRENRSSCNHRGDCVFFRVAYTLN